MTRRTNRVAIASTLHDPEGRLAPLIANHADPLAALSERLHLACSPQTADRTWRSLNRSDLHAHRSSHHYQGLYRDALLAACTRGVTRVFHCDFDRLLHWLATYPQELMDILDGRRIHAHDYLQFGRTDRAYRSHPPTQTRTERLLNVTLSCLLGFDATRDFYATCFASSPEVLERLTALPSTNRFGFYAAWPFVAWRAAKNPGYLEVEGLEWETPDRFKEEIRAVDFDTWLERYQTAGEWAHRIRVVEDGIWAILITHL